MRLGGGKAIHPIGLEEESGAAERYTCIQLYLNKALMKLSVYLKRRRKRRKGVDNCSSWVLAARVKNG